MQLGNFHVQIPAQKDCSSLNLAAAVLVIAYELYKAESSSIERSTDEEVGLWDQEFATREQVEYFYDHLERVMINIDFHDPKNPRQLMQRMRRLFGRIRLDVMELNILRGVLSNIEQSIKKSEKNNK